MRTALHYGPVPCPAPQFPRERKPTELVQQLTWVDQTPVRTLSLTFERELTDHRIANPTIGPATRSSVFLLLCDYAGASSGLFSAENEHVVLTMDLPRHAPPDEEIRRYFAVIMRELLADREHWYEHFVPKRMRQERT